MIVEDSSPNDTDLMLQLQRGDDLALNALMTRWQQPLVNFIYRYIGNETEALDLAQETFMRVFESRHRYKPSAKFSTWLFTIASNLCRNFFRWQKRHPTVPLTAETDDSNLAERATADRAASPAEAVEQRERAEAVRRHIHALPHDLKSAILLFEYEDLSHQEIAGVLGCSVKAVETRLYRARNILREKLAPAGIR